MSDPPFQPGETKIKCPNCSIIAKQSVYAMYVDQYENPTELLQNINQRRLILKGIEKLSDQSGTGPEAYGNFYVQNISIFPVSSPKEVYPVSSLFLSNCQNCGKSTVWFNDLMIYPQFKQIKKCPEMPTKVAEYFDEANLILELSPRGAIAILRLAIEELIKQFEKNKKSLNTEIRKLERDGYNKNLIEALDVVRIMGNYAVHPSEIGFEDHRAVAEELFVLVNYIADKMNFDPAKIDNVLKKLPKSLINKIKSQESTNNKNDSIEPQKLEGRTKQITNKNNK